MLAKRADFILPFFILIPKVFGFKISTFNFQIGFVCNDFNKVKS